ncbi:hypothetical protein KGY73_11450, partial [bacterium]|nr:hypothetical protein [bacterium]
EDKKEALSLIFDRFIGDSLADSKDSALDRERLHTLNKNTNTCLIQSRERGRERGRDRGREKGERTQ